MLVLEDFNAIYGQLDYSLKIDANFMKHHKNLWEETSFSVVHMTIVEKRHL